ncbi:MAG: hypothetical protein JSR70_09455 [Proteobacteria bacterium]|nr:hypothetical protein [Pseudomonadota bacterium]
MEIATREIDLKKKAAEQDFAEHKITAQRLRDIEVQLANDKLAIIIGYYNAKKKLDQANTKEVTKDDQEIRDAQLKNRAAVSAADHKLTMDMQKDWMKTAQTIQQSVGGALKGMILQNRSFADVGKAVLAQWAETAIDNSLKTLFTHQAVEQAKTASTITGDAIRTTSGVTSATTTSAATTGAAIKDIMAKGASVIANVWNSIAAIPYVGPFLAPAMAVAAGAAVVGLVSKVPSAAGGWGQVPNDTFANIHKDEMVLPADLAQGVRKMARMDGGSSGGNSVHIHTTDPRSWGEYLRRNPSAMASAMKFAQRNGHFGQVTL